MTMEVNSVIREESPKGAVSAILMIEDCRIRLTGIVGFRAKERIVAYPNQSLSGEGPRVFLRPMGDWSGEFRIDDSDQEQLLTDAVDMQSPGSLYVYTTMPSGLRSTAEYKHAVLRRDGVGMFSFVASSRKDIS